MDDGDNNNSDEIGLNRIVSIICALFRGTKERDRNRNGSMRVRACDANDVEGQLKQQQSYDVNNNNSITNSTCP